MPNPDSISPSCKVRYYATNAADIDLVAIGGTLCRAIRSKSDGNIKIVDGGGEIVTIPFLAGETQIIQASMIVSSGTTSSMGITVLW